MALQAAYQQFLAAPNSAALAANASLHYITTTTSHNGATDIIKHLNTLRNQVKKKKETVLSLVESKDGLAAEVDTALEFINGGGAYLPDMDDNFLADRTVYLPIVHFVAFDSDGKIAQIRQSWDQGSLLKQLEIIGKTGRNWPIRDSTEQIRLITNSINKAPAPAAAAAPAPAAAVASSGPVPMRSRGNSSQRDPHAASLALYGSREELENDHDAVVSPYAGSRPPQRDFAEIFGDTPNEDNSDTPRASMVSPYAGSRPHQRSFTDILGEESEEVQSPSKGRERSQSPSKAIAPKIGAGKNFQPSRLFDQEEVPSDPNTPDKLKSPERHYRPHPKKYNHFDFADGSDPQDAPVAGVQPDAMPKTRHNSQWSFNDFVTPQKLRPQKATRAQDVRHWGTENDTVEDTPAKKPVANKPRRDAETHFEFRDDGLPSADAARAGQRPRGSVHNAKMHLYENNVHSQDDAAAGGAPADARALGNITNLKDRSKIFDPHFVMTDEAPSGSATPTRPAASEDRMKVVKMMEANWAAYDDSPGAPGGGAQKENQPIAIAGDGMGGKKGKDAGLQQGKPIAIAGDGMGGKKGAGGGRGWAIGDDSGDEGGAAPAPVPGKTLGAQQKTAGKGFWEF